MNKSYIYSVSSLLQIDRPYLCHISCLTAVTYCRLELQPVVTKIPKCDIRPLSSLFGILIDGLICNTCIYTMVCPPVRGDNPRALANRLSPVQAVIQL